MLPLLDVWLPDAYACDVSMCWCLFVLRAGVLCAQAAKNMASLKIQGILCKSFGFWRYW